MNHTEVVTELQTGEASRIIEPDTREDEWTT